MRNNEANQYSQGLAQQELVHLYTIKTTTGEYIHLTPNTNKDGITEKITYAGIEFLSFPIEMNDLEYSSSGSSPRPKLTVSNIAGVFSSVDFSSTNTYDVLIGSTVTKRTTFLKYILSTATGPLPIEQGLIHLENNLPQLKKEVYILDRISSKSIVSVEFELASPYDLHSIKVPSKQISGGYCPFIYKGARNYEIPGANTIGGCTWNNQVNRTSVDKLGNEINTPLTVYMNQLDEYIVEFTNETFIEINLNNLSDPSLSLVSEIKEGHYYYEQYDTETKIDFEGSLVPNSIVKDYWQALESIPDGQLDENIHAPSDTSRFWRRVRVFKRYDPSKEVCAYVDKNRNEYVYFESPASNETFLFIERTNQSTLTTTLGNEVTVFIFENFEGFDPQNLDQVSLFTPEGTQLQKITPNLNDPLFGLTKTDEFVILQDDNQQGGINSRIFTLKPASTLNLTVFDNEQISVDNLYQVRSVTQKAGQHSQFPAYNDTWVAGDVCGKSLTSCSLRFQAVNFLDQETEELLNNAGNLAQVSILPANISVSNNNINVGGSVIALLKETGFVVPFTRGINREAISNAINTNEDEPLLINDTDEVVYYTDDNISTVKGDIRLEILDSSNASDPANQHNTFIGSVHGVKVGNAEVVYPMPAGVANENNVVILTSMLFAYQKITGNNIRLYYSPESVVSADNSINNTKTAADIVAEGHEVDLKTKTGGVKVTVQNTIPCIDGNNEISAGHNTQINQQEIFLDFTTNDTTEATQYIATDRATTVAMPFGGFPGTRRFS